MGLTRKSAALAAVLAVTACAAQESSSDTSGTATEQGSPSTSPSTESSSTPSGTTDESSGIRSVDFGNRTWKAPTTADETVTLKDGSGDGPDGTYELQEREITYDDLDGDGHEDALVALMATERGSNGYLMSHSIWLWDEGEEDAVQVQPAVTVDERCGDVTKGVEPAGDERLTVRIGTERQACAGEPQEEETVTVALEDGFVWQTSPTTTALHCPPVARRGLNYPGSDMGDEGLRAWPDSSAPVVVTGKDMSSMDVDDDNAGVPEGWNRIIYKGSGPDTDADPGTEKVEAPCGYFPKP